MDILRGLPVCKGQLGTELDTVYDAVGLLIAPVLAVTYGQLHWSYLLVSIAYYLFVIGIKLREFRGLRVIELPPNISRRAIAGFQMGFVAVVLLPCISSTYNANRGNGIHDPICCSDLLLTGLLSGEPYLRGQAYLYCWIS